MSKKNVSGASVYCGVSAGRSSEAMIKKTLADSPSGSSAAEPVHFMAIHSRVGKKYQAVVPPWSSETSSASSSSFSFSSSCASSRRSQEANQSLAKCGYCVDKANALGADLQSYLDFAVELMSDVTHDTQEQIVASALNVLHRFEYNAQDAACSLYARHTLERPQELGKKEKDDTVKWLRTFYELFRHNNHTRRDLDEMKALQTAASAITTSSTSSTVIDPNATTNVMANGHATASSAANANNNVSTDAKDGIAEEESTNSCLGLLESPEFGMLSRFVARATKWLENCAQLREKVVDTSEIRVLLNEAEDMELNLPEQQEFEARLATFDMALVTLKDAIEKSNRRNQTKVHLEELERLYETVVATYISFDGQQEIQDVLNQARELKQSIASILNEDKVSLPAIREAMAKIDTVPVNFDREVDLFQTKMLNAQTWLAKARKCISKRRATRRTGVEPKRMDLNSVRELITNAPCEDTTEMSEMQELLECADEWAERVRHAIENGSDVPLEELKELMEDGEEMPVEMEEQHFLAAEIAAREWSTDAESLLKQGSLLQELVEMGEKAKTIREMIHPKKQNRWKPQAERDIHACMDIARRWFTEVREFLGPVMFDRLLPNDLASLPAFVAPSAASGAGATGATAGATAIATTTATATLHSNKHDGNKRSLDSFSKLIDKSKRINADVSRYVEPLQELLATAESVQQQAQELLESIGYKSMETEVNEQEETDQEGHEGVDAVHKLQTRGEEPESEISSEEEPTKQKGDFTQACALLEKIQALPLTFPSGRTLEHLIEDEREWATQVREAIPPRQSRKKRQLKDQIGIEQLDQLLSRAARLHFNFTEEMNMLHKELEEVHLWQQHAREKIQQMTTAMADKVNKLKEFDLTVYRCLKGMAHTDDEKTTVTDGGETTTDGTTQQVHLESMKEEKMETVVVHELAVVDNSVVTQAQDNSCFSTKTEPEDTKDADVVEAEAAAAVLVDAMTSNATERVIEIQALINHLRSQSGCSSKTSDTNPKKVANAKVGLCTMDTLLVMVEESLVAVTALELKEDTKPKNVDGLPLEDTKIRDDTVKSLDVWAKQLSSLTDESSLLNCRVPEQQLLDLLCDLFKWLQDSRSIFYGEALPLKALVEHGNSMRSQVHELFEACQLNTHAQQVVQLLLYPLTYMESHLQVVESWTRDVTSCLQDKHISVDRMQRVLTEGARLLMEPEALKPVLDEIKRVRSWLSKLRKRVKSLMTKKIGRLALAVARGLVEEAQDFCLDIPAFDFLKEHVEAACDWEKRVMASGLDNGSARIAYLLQLLDEYEGCGWIIDLDMHRDVLKSATERFCICRQPFDGVMIGCDLCDDWFHDTCIGLSKEKAEKVENYTCPSCSLLKELTELLAQVTTSTTSVWQLEEFEKNYEKQRGFAMRKLKREEKAVERAEMMLLSCTNHMQQLQQRVDEIERAKTCLTLKQSFENNAVQVAKGLFQSTLVAAAAVVDPASVASSSTSSSSVSCANGTMESTTPAAEGFNFAQRYPNILLPPTRPNPGTGIPTRLLPMPSAEVPGGATPHEPETNRPSSSTTQTSEVSLSSSTVSSGVGTTTTAATSAMLHPAPVAVATPTPGSMVSAMADAIPRMLSPMMPKIAENERLAALVAAGGVEQQLGKMKTELTELQAQAGELDRTLMSSRERCAKAKRTAEELEQTHGNRQTRLPFAQAWIRKVIQTINQFSVLTRNGDPPVTNFTISVYEDRINEAKANGIEEFAEVQAFTRCMRCIAWSLVIVGLLQERPSREEIVEAIQFATDHNLYEPKVLVPLKNVVGRIDLWISKAQKLVIKPGGSKPQRIVRLRALLNEYSKLPMTCAYFANVEESLQQLESERGNAEALQAVSDDAMHTIDDLAVGASSTPSSSNGSTSASSLKTPRKRKPVSRKDRNSSTKKPRTSATTSANNTPRGGKRATKAAKTMTTTSPSSSRVSSPSVGSVATPTGTTTTTSAATTTVAAPPKSSSRTSPVPSRKRKASVSVDIAMTTTSS